MGLPRARILLSSLVVLWAVTLAAEAQEANFGKKVKCYLTQGTVVCPGCNSRAGLLCPRTNLQSCDVNQEFPYTPEEIYTTQIFEDETEPTVIKETQGFKPTNTTYTTPLLADIAEEDIEYWAKLARENKEFRLFLYRILHYGRPVAPRGKRDVQQRAVQDDGEICKWNGDCPCPLICCKTGEGCPKRCRKGIKLPPPWG